MTCGLTFRLGRTRLVDGRSSALGTLLRIRSLADYTIDTHEFEVFGSHSWMGHNRPPSDDDRSIADAGRAITALRQCDIGDTYPEKAFSSQCAL
jgi:hypothetical protein